MEKRALIAVGLSVLVLLAYQYFYIPSAPVQRAQPQAVNAPASQLSNATVTASAASAPTAIQNTAAAAPATRSINVTTDLYTAVFSTRGATLTSMSLNKFKDPEGKPISILQGGSPALAIGSKEDFSLSEQPFECDAPEAITLGPGHESATLTCRYSDAGRAVQRTYTFKQDSYLINIHDDVRGLPEYEITLGTALGINVPDKSLHTGPVALVDTDRKEYKEGKIEATETLTGPLKWVALEDKYFFSALVPGTSIGGARVWKGRDAAGAIGIFSPQGTGSYDFTLYAGPKELDNLKKLNLGIEHIVDFGFFSIIARPIFWMLNRINALVHNYGWSIIMLTILIRIPFIPIVNKGQESMRRLQELQPRMAEIKEKFAKDPPAHAARDDGPIQKAQGKPYGRMPADAASDTGVLRALQGAAGIDRAEGRAVCALDTRPLGEGPLLRPSARDGRLYVSSAEDDPRHRRRHPEEGHDAHARSLHVHVPELRLGARALLVVNNLLSISQQLYVMKKKKAA